VIPYRFDGPSDDQRPVLAPSTLPRLNRRHRRPSLSIFRTDFENELSSKGSIRSPDRFLPNRRPTLEKATESFRANKDPSALSPEEKLLRQKEASPDAFHPRRTVTSPMPPLNRSQGRRTFSGNRSGGGGKSTLSGHSKLLTDFVQEEVFLRSNGIPMLQVARGRLVRNVEILEIPILLCLKMRISVADNHR